MKKPIEPYIQEGSIDLSQIGKYGTFLTKDYFTHFHVEGLFDGQCSNKDRRVALERMMFYFEKQVEKEFEEKVKATIDLIKSEFNSRYHVNELREKYSHLKKTKQQIGEGFLAFLE